MCGVLFNVDPKTIQKDIVSLICLIRIEYGNLDKDINKYIEELKNKYAIGEGDLL